jgi:hypothetical protein
VRIVGTLLGILPRDRPEVSQLFNHLDAIMTQVRLDLKNENFYINTLPTEVRIAALPSSVSDSDGERADIASTSVQSLRVYGDNR